MNIKSMIIIVLVVVVGILVAYNRLSNITFVNNRAQVSNLYCKLSGNPKITKPVILIPGTKGSLLKGDSGNVWLSFGQILASSQPLIYGPGENIKASGILTRISIVPKLLEYRPYFGIASALACSPNTYFFYYDWRKNPADNIPQLEELIARVTQETGQKPSIIAHSMGGLITHYYMKEHADTLDKVVYAGVPFGSGLSFLEDIDNGSPVGLNRTILSPEALFSHPGSFALLPHPGVKLYKDQDLMSFETWKKNKLSIYKNSVPDDKLLEANLQKAKDFFSVLDRPQSMSNEFLFVIGNCQDTLYSIKKDSQKTFKKGDGRVLQEAALPVNQAELNKKVIMSCSAHDQLLNSKETISAIFQFLQ